MDEFEKWLEKHIADMANYPEENSGRSMLNMALHKYRTLKQEPLEDLAKRKGVKFIHLSGSTIGFFFTDITDCNKIKPKEFEYCYTSESSRKWLNGLEDKEGK